MGILVFGSLNIDHVYRVPHLVRPGETLASSSYRVLAGGKGANQSMALARAGAQVAHAGKVGTDGQWLVDRLAAAGADTRFVEIDATATTGHAIIQVDDAGQNAIVLHAGANHEIDAHQVEATLAHHGPGDVLLLQNEVNDVAALIAQGARRGMNVWLNPAPFDERIRDYPLELVKGLIVNETEALGLSGTDVIQAALATLARRYPHAELVVTRGASGCAYRSPTLALDVPAAQVAEVVDTTGAGDTFIGYFLASRARGLDVQAALDRACRAAALCVSRPGAMDSIPHGHEVDAAPAP